MRRMSCVWGSVAVILALAIPALAQGDWDAVSPSDSVVTFGAVYTGDTDSMLVTLTNSLAVDVEVLEAGFEEDVFSVGIVGQVIPALGDLDFYVYFATVQNIDYTDFLRIELDHGLRPLVIEVSAEGHFPDAYYDATRNLWAEDLKDVLTSIIDGHNSLGYNIARDHMYGSIDNVDGWVTCVYTGRTAFFNTREGATANGFNCEHTWPQSFSNELEPMKSDLFHLYPTDDLANNKRGNYDFGIVVTPSWMNGGSKLGTDSDGQTVFEPRDVHKGNVARSHFYYIIRYDGNYNGYQNAAKMEAHFRDWHVSDPVDSAEQARNEAIYALQYNRNPFIDYPALADRISSFFGTAVHSLDPEVAVAPGTADMGMIDFDTTAYAYIAIINTGTDTLEVASITSTDPDFAVNTAGMALAPETYEYVRVTYTSGEAELTDSTEILIACNDSDEASIGVPVTVEVGDVSGIDDAEAWTAGDVLHQNRPNPFGRCTTIGFSLERPGRVDLSIYNIEGRLVERLIPSETLTRGEHRVEFEAGDLPSGVYYCRLVIGEHDLCRPMLILRGLEP
jgi:deoxyribonuclease-1